MEATETTSGAHSTYHHPPSHSHRSPSDRPAIAVWSSGCTPQLGRRKTPAVMYDCRCTTPCTPSSNKDVRGCCGGTHKAASKRQSACPLSGVTVSSVQCRRRRLLRAADSECFVTERLLDAIVPPFLPLERSSDSPVLDICMRIARCRDLTAFFWPGGRTSEVLVNVH